MSHVRNLRVLPNPEAHHATTTQQRRIRARGPLNWAHDPDITDSRPITITLTDVEWSLLLAVLEHSDRPQAVQDLGADIRSQVRRRWTGDAS